MRLDSPIPSLPSGAGAVDQVNVGVVRTVCRLLHKRDCKVRRFHG